MSSIDLQTLCNWIVLIAAAMLAVVNIAKLLYQPSVFFKKKKAAIEKERDEKMAKQIDKVLTEHDSELSSEFIGQLQDRFTILSDADERIEAELKNNRSATVDLLRQQIVNIYYEYLEEQKLPIYVRENLDELYKDYIVNNGNHFITKIYKRMEKWPVIPTDTGMDI